MTDYNSIIKKFDFRLTGIRIGIPSTEYTAKSVLDKYNGSHCVMCFERGPGETYIDYHCDNNLTVRLYKTGKIELTANTKNKLSPSNKIKLTGENIIENE